MIISASKPQARMRRHPRVTDYHGLVCLVRYNPERSWPQESKLGEFRFSRPSLLKARAEARSQGRYSSGGPSSCCSDPGCLSSHTWARWTNGKAVIIIFMLWKFVHNDCREYIREVKMCITVWDAWSNWWNDVTKLNDVKSTRQIIRVFKEIFTSPQKLL